MQHKFHRVILIGGIWVENVENEANNNTAMIGENRQLVTDEPVEFEK